MRSEGSHQFGIHPIGLSSEAKNRQQHFEQESSRIESQLANASMYGRPEDLNSALGLASKYPHLKIACQDARRAFENRKKQINHSLNAAIEGRQF